MEESKAVNNNNISLKKKIEKLFENRTFVGAFIGAIVFCIISVVSYNNLLDDFEFTTIGWRFKYFNNNSHPSDNCIVVGIDSTSIDKYGRWPWSRRVLAELLEALDFYGAKSMAFDIMFKMHDKYDKNADLDFVNAIKKLKNNGKSVTIATKIDPLPNKKNYYTKEDLEKLRKLTINAVNRLEALSLKDIYIQSTYNKPQIQKLKELEDKLRQNNKPLDKDFYQSEGQGYDLVMQKPYKEIFDNISSMGFVNVILTKEEAIKTPIIAKYKQKSFGEFYFPILALAVYLDGNKLSVKQNKNSITAGNKKILTLKDNNFYINWYLPDNEEEVSQLPYDTYPVVQVLESYRFLEKVSAKTGLTKEYIQDQINQYWVCAPQNKCSASLKKFIEEEFPGKSPVVESKDYKNKYVFIGVTDQSAGSRDVIETPVNDEIPGVYLHANMLDNFLQENFIKETSEEVQLLVILILAVSVGITVLGVKNPIYGVGIGIIYLFYFIVPLFLFNNFHIYTDFFYTELAVVLTFSLSISYKSWIADKDKKFLRRTFSNYLSPQILNEVLSDPSKVRLGGKRKEISILFSDIRGFTTISEQSEPEEIVRFLNEYFDEMVDQVMKTEGTLDKFIGDAVMAFWGAPMEYDNHAEMAVKGALGMVESLNKLKKKWKTEGKNYPEINIGIGINTGPALVGNVGSTKLKNYTIIGDSVNLASRLEGLNKKYATHEENEINIIISEYTYEHIKDIFDVKYLGEETVKGKDIPVKIYRVTGIKGGNQ